MFAPRTLKFHGKKPLYRFFCPHFLAAILALDIFVVRCVAQLLAPMDEVVHMVSADAQSRVAVRVNEPPNAVDLLGAEKASSLNGTGAWGEGRETKGG